MAKTISLEFDGYWLESGKKNVIDSSGIYNVYTCSFDKETDKVSLSKHVYTGESSNVRARLDDHEKQGDWEKHLKKGEQLCFSVCKVASTDRVRAEAAMIHKHNPPVNSEYVDKFPYEETTIKLTGKKKYLASNFTVHKVV